VHDQLQKFNIVDDKVKPSFILSSDATGRGILSYEEFVLGKKGKYLFTHNRDSLYIWDAVTGKLLDTMVSKAEIDQYKFSSDENYLMLLGRVKENIAVIKWFPGKKIKSTKIYNNDLGYLGNRFVFNSLSINPSDKFAVFSSTNRHLTVYDLEKEKILYYLIPLGFSAYSVFDTEGRFDGIDTTDVYYNCNNQIVPLSDVSSNGFEPKLLYKIMHPQKTFLVSKSISQLEICRLLSANKKSIKYGNFQKNNLFVAGLYPLHGTTTVSS
jgi:WD40 repeat protein